MGDRPVSRTPRLSPLLVNPRQRGNSILGFVRNVSYTFGPINMVVDYEVGASAGILFLRYELLLFESFHI